MASIKVKLTREENAAFYGVPKDTVMEVDLVDYVAGVVAAEVGNASTNAARAQAIAARTYAHPFYSTGKTITDTTQHQAFRIQRVASGKYPNAVKAAQDTDGMLLYYGGKVITSCVYSAGNGGRTVSSKEKWGGDRPWLIAQDDPWDAATHTAKSGHGVGMSQRGACYAASIGVSYQEILKFYYHGTEIHGAVEVPPEGEVKSGMIKATDLIEQCKIPLAEGWGYIWGQAGAVWTQAKQDAVGNNTRIPESSRNMAVKYGKKWIGKKVTDCSGLFYWAYKQLGASITHGSNSIWKSYCKSKGTITPGIQLKPGTAVFLTKGTNRHHIGLFIGNDTVIEAKGTMYGVVTSPVSHWDEWGELSAVDYGGEASEEVQEAKPTLKKGATGTAVQLMQELLGLHGYAITPDGVFGSGTLEAVKNFQLVKGLTVDGICGPKTWAALGDKPADPEPVEDDNGDKPETRTAEEILSEIKTLVAELESVIKA